MSETVAHVHVDSREAGLRPYGGRTGPSPVLHDIVMEDGLSPTASIREQQNLKSAPLPTELRV